MRNSDAYFRDLPNTQQKYDYDVRTDGQPVYMGHANIDAADGTVQGWCVFYFQYNVSGFVTSIQSKRGTWTGRVALFA